MACNGLGQNKKNLLAKVSGQSLYLSDVEQTLGDNLRGPDSLEQLRSYVNAWVRDEIVSQEVRKNVSVDDEIEHLLKSYESSLLNDRFEKQLISSLLDTTISQGVVQNYYDKNRARFKLTENIYQVKFAIIEESRPKIDQFLNSWESNKDDEIRQYCVDHADLSYLDTEKWYSESHLLSLLPEDLFPVDNWNTGRNFQKNRNDYEYFLKIAGKLDKNEIAPLSYVEDDIRKIIYQTRKLALINNWKQGLFDQAFKNNKAKIYLQ